MKKFVAGHNNRKQHRVVQEKKIMKIITIFGVKNYLFRV